MIAHDDTTCKLLCEDPVGGKAFANPVSYIGADGKQHITIACGHALFACVVDSCPNRLPA